MRLPDIDDKGAGWVIGHAGNDGGGFQRIVGVTVADAEEPAVQVVLVLQLVIVCLVFIAENPLDCVARGTGAILESPDTFSRTLFFDNRPSR